MMIVMRQNLTQLFHVIYSHLLFALCELAVSFLYYTTYFCEMDCELKELENDLDAIIQDQNIVHINFLPGLIRSLSVAILIDLNL